MAIEKFFLCSFNYHNLRENSAQRIGNYSEETINRRTLISFVRNLTNPSKKFPSFIKIPKFYQEFQSKSLRMDKNEGKMVRNPNFSLFWTTHWLSFLSLSISTSQFQTIYLNSMKFPTFLLIQNLSGIENFESTSFPSNQN